ncbi:carboxymuconolactone decarboxylase family protein [Microbacterium sp. YY-01]|uniref:carboxymuconolactone decarboxylase family protein n=1 Tax=Microbacterium sp. YY-01 TaxID=3421634 RepID=UPI003D1755B8
MTHHQRINIQTSAPAAYQAVFPLQKYVNSSSIDKELLALVDIRASQINNCAWCLDMHVAQAREAGSSQRRIDLVAAWQEAGDLFSEREQAALAFTEQVTLVSDGGVSDDVWQRLRQSFSEQESIDLLMAIAAINVWNRMNVTARTALPGEERDGRA